MNRLRNNAQGNEQLRLQYYQEHPEDNPDNF